MVCFLDKQIIEKIKKLKPKLREKYYVEKIGIFGSYARGEEKEESDVDIIVKFFRPIGWDFVDLKDFLEKELDKKIDLTTENALKPQIKEAILSEVRYQ